MVLDRYRQSKTKLLGYNFVCFIFFHVVLVDIFPLSSQLKSRKLQQIIGSNLFYPVKSKRLTSVSNVLIKSVSTRIYVYKIVLFIRMLYFSKIRYFNYYNSNYLPHFYIKKIFHTLFFRGEDMLMRKNWEDNDDPEFCFLYILYISTLFVLGIAIFLLVSARESD